jgi:hypothetical protein
MNYAGLDRRLRAFVWDYLLILGFIMLLGMLSRLAPPVQALFQRPVQRQVAAFVVLVLPVVLYFSLAEGSVSGTTWGKHKERLQVVCKNGCRLGMVRSFVRSMLKFLPWQIAHIAIYQSLPGRSWPATVIWLLYGLAYGLALLYLLMIWRRADHRAPYDRLAGAAVIETKRVAGAKTTSRSSQSG